ncbi:hypothetical protein niasHT_009096 [Heterodera trifolii]|uniref:Uncharacterized protein n=1 Tax=Heterodera trifolii TaxID=157864 RepID=A0ABD2L210_9BILA
MSFYTVHRDQLPLRALFNQHGLCFQQRWHSPHYKYSEVLGGTYHIPHSRYPPHDVYKTPWLCHLHPTHLTPGEPDWWY